MLDRILVPLDGSRLAESIFPSLLPLARKLGSNIVLLAVNEHGKERWNEGGFEARPAGGKGESPVQLLERSITGVIAPGIKEYLSGVEGYLARRGLRAESRFACGKVAHEILAQGEASGCGLIAMSTRGRSGLGRGLLGSVTDAVVRTSRIPVMVCRPERTADIGHKSDTVRESNDLKRIVVPLDGSPLAEVVLSLVEDLAQQLSLEVALVRVVRLAALAYAGMERMPVDVSDLQAELEKESKEYLDEVAGRMRTKEIRVTTAVLTGLPGRGTIDFMGGMDGSMAALSTHGRSGLSRMVLGSVANELIKGLDTPVLVIHPGMPEVPDP